MRFQRKLNERFHFVAYMQSWSFQIKNIFLNFFYIIPTEDFNSKIVVRSPIAVYRCANLNVFHFDFTHAYLFISHAMK